MSFNSTIKLNGRFQYSLGHEEADKKFHEVALKLSMEEFNRQQEAEKRKRHTPIVREINKIGRNDLCPCFSGKKFKKCCINK